MGDKEKDKIKKTVFNDTVKEVDRKVFGISKEAEEYKSEKECNIEDKLWELSTNNWFDEIKPNATMKFGGIKDHNYSTKQEYFKSIKKIFKKLNILFFHKENKISIEKEDNSYVLKGIISFLFKNVGCLDFNHKDYCKQFHRNIYAKNANLMFVKSSAISYEYQQFLGNLLLHDPSDITPEEMETINDKNVEAIKVSGDLVSKLFDKKYNEKNINHKKWFDSISKKYGKKNKEEVNDFIKNYAKKDLLYILYSVFK